ncbi:MAG: DUF952 domain-containing protein [Acidimicrobiia bacterium]|jgi:glutathione S-transferase|nr:DUF952 domain-containing protein [Acidimicrobiia bacterium]MBA3984207.1 DUF952 domain-containing protein [Acidimicrobiia bacterium]MDQ3390800.1 DUF952 domain-containing protein [Actinomycetota bacterium]
MPGNLYHAAIPEEWERARIAGSYTVSTRERSLDDEGFIHCSYHHQVEQVANNFYADLPDLMLLEIDPTQLNVAVLDENLDGGDERFPHVYGPVPLHAIVAASPWIRSPDGRYVLDAGD